ncbi:MAG: carboxypeptidase regulatory-like domain-containing protein [Flavobacterium sp.]|nr:MAG: carboxypeptidase regulatory-like domain-containing protein [Flavobacterium sp.]
MKTKAISIQIADPCQQNWETMEDRNKERFCESCQKCVVDFSNHTNAEIVKAISEAKDEVCGRLSVEQLNQLHYYLVAVPSNKNWLKYLGVLAIGASLFANEAKAIGVKVPVEITTTNGKSITDAKPIKTKMIYGYVVDENNKPIADSVVLITGTKFSAKTDKNGRYELLIPGNLDVKINRLKIASMQYYVEINYNVVKQKNLVLHSTPMILGKIAILPRN